MNGKNIDMTRTLTKQMGLDIKTIRTSGFGAIVHSLYDRAVLTIGIAIICFLTLFIPSRVLFVSIEGTENISDMRILEHAEEVGIYFGASRKTVRSEKVKNALLERMPNLKWVGINTYGCVAVISVLERESTEITEYPESVTQGIYAVQDGIISSIVVTKGTALCKPGQAVRKNQLLVSGYTDAGMFTRAERAAGEVYGITQHNINAVLPDLQYKRNEIISRSSNWQLQIGKKQINLHIGSGNYSSGCGKIYKTYQLTLPGGFVLPISLVKETFYIYDQSTSNCRSSDAELNRLSRKYVDEQMIAGKIIHLNTTVNQEVNGLRLVGVYTCEELIGKLKNEEIR